VPLLIYRVDLLADRCLLRRTGRASQLLLKAELHLPESVEAAVFAPARDTRIDHGAQRIGWR
jgi:hypothetical protein